MKLRLLLLPVLWSAAHARAAAPAFPGVEGAGSNATGGRGGEVVHVTNLNASGPGSFAEAVSQGDRIVVFDVSGIIDLMGKKKGGKVAIEHPNITVLGQTAPGEGICLKNGCLEISASNVIVRYLRSRRGWIQERDTGDAIEVKPASLGETTAPAGQTQEAFDKRKSKKAARGKFMHEFASLSDIVIDHCSTSWATDENLTMTHSDRTTLSWSIAAEGCDYHNPKQTPPNHSEGSLWGSAAPDGRATMHHVLYAQNRLRNPRSTGGADQPPVLTLYNNVVYDWSEYASHTGSERVFINWLNNYYKPGPDTPEDIRAHGFEFHGDPGARVFGKGNFMAGSPEATTNNKLAIFHGSKFRKVSAEDKEAMKVDAAFGETPKMESAEQAFESVLADAGATLPARDTVDLRIVNGVRDGKGRIIEKETSLAETERWPEYRSLPILAGSGQSGIPDAWAKRFGLHSSDAAKIAADGYANIEHYANNTDPTGNGTVIVHIAATVSRASPGVPGEWEVTRGGDLSRPLTVKYSVSDDAQAAGDREVLPGTVTIPAGKASALIPLHVYKGEGQVVAITLDAGQTDYAVGCPGASLVVTCR